MKCRYFYTAMFSLIALVIFAQENSEISADLYFNEGNKAYSDGNYGDAVFHYERALLIEPRSEDINVNLKLAVENLETDIVELDPFFLSEWWQGLVDTFLPGTWKLVSILLLILLLFIAYIYLFKSLLKKEQTYALGGIIFICCLVSILAGYNRSTNIYNSEYGIVTGDAKFLHEGPDPVSDDVKSVVSGVKVKVLDSNGDWYKVKAMDSEQGWILKKQVKMLRFL